MHWNIPNMDNLAGFVLFYIFSARYTYTIIILGIIMHAHFPNQLNELIILKWHFDLECMKNLMNILIVWL